MSLNRGRTAGSVPFDLRKQRRERKVTVASRQARTRDIEQAKNALSQGNIRAVDNTAVIPEASKQLERASHAQNIRTRERMYKESMGALDPVVFTSINFSILDDAQLEEVATAEITNTSQSGPGSLYDPKMGATRTDVCATCGLSDIYCRGHVGFIRLARPMIHPLLIDIIIGVLSSVCHSCSQLLVDKKWMQQNDMFELQGVARIKALAKRIIKLPCAVGEREGLGCIQNPAKYNSSVSKTLGVIKMTYSASTKNNDDYQEMDIYDVQRIIKNISYEDAELMGFQRGSHPKALIRRLWPIMTPCARAPVVHAAGTEYDQIDKQYTKIMKYNDEIRELMTRQDLDSVNKVKNLAQQLYISIKELAEGQSKEGKSTFMSLNKYLDKKEGIIRKNILSARMPLSTRLVITNDPNMKIGELRIPQFASRILTKEEKVTSQNQHQIEQWAKQGIVEFVTLNRGVNAGRLIDYSTNKVNISVGDTVVRRAIDGDYVMFVRQPVHLKIGFMGYRVSICPDPRVLTFGMNLANTDPHHADFDGDEMTAFSIMSDQVKFLAGATENIISGITGRPIYKATYNVATSLYLLTSENRILTRKTFFNLLQGVSTILETPLVPPPTTAKTRVYLKMYGLPVAEQDAPEEDFERWLQGNTLFARAYRKGLPLTSNKILFSAILPQELYYSHAGVVIEEGILLRGSIGKAHVGGGPQTIAQKIFDLYQQSGLLEQQRTIRFLDDAYILGDNFFAWRGFSLGISSMLLKTGKVETKLEVEEAQQLRSVLKAMLNAVILNQPDKLNAAYLRWQAIYTPARFPSIIALQTQLAQLLDDPLPLPTKERLLVTTLNKVTAEVADLARDRGIENLRTQELELLNTRLDQLGELGDDDLRNEVRERRKTAIIQGFDGRAQNLFKQGQIQMESDEFDAMIKAGSKGKLGSLSQFGFIGYQQYLGGKLHSPNSNVPGRNYNMSRANPWTPIGRDIAQARKFADQLEYGGFIKNPFIKGLSLSEAMATAAPARESSMNSNLDVSRTGYQQRKVATAAMDIVIASDFTARTATTESEVPSVVSWSYGEGFRIEKMLEVNLEGRMRKSVIDLESWAWQHNRDQGWTGRNAIVVIRNDQHSDLGSQLSEHKISGDDSTWSLYSLTLKGINFVVWNLPSMTLSRYTEILDTLPYVTRAYTVNQNILDRADINEIEVDAELNLEDELNDFVYEIKADPVSWQPLMRPANEAVRQVGWANRPAALRGLAPGLEQASTSILTPAEIA